MQSFQEDGSNDNFKRLMGDTLDIREMIAIAAESGVTMTAFKSWGPSREAKPWGRQAYSMKI